MRPDLILFLLLLLQLRCLYSPLVVLGQPVSRLFVGGLRTRSPDVTTCRFFGQLSGGATAKFPALFHSWSYPKLNPTLAPPIPVGSCPSSSPIFRSLDPSTRQLLVLSGPCFPFVWFAAEFSVGKRGESEFSFPLTRSSCCA